MDIITVENRKPETKAKQLRRMGIVPCTVYGGALECSYSVQMSQKDANQLCSHCRDGGRVQLSLDDQVLTAQIKEYTRNPDNKNVMHISFQALQAGQMVNSVVHIYRKNAEKVPGLVEQVLDEVSYKALPQNMVESVTLDLEGKTVGTDITLGDIPELCSDKLTLQLPKDTLVLRISEQRAAPVEETEE